MSDSYSYDYSGNDLSIYVIMGIAFGSVILIIVAVTTCACCYSRNHKSVTPENTENPRSNVQEVEPSRNDIESQSKQTQNTNRVMPTVAPVAAIPTTPSAPPQYQQPPPPFLPPPIPSPPLNHYTAFSNPYNLYVPMQNYQFSAHTAHIHLPPISYPQVPNGMQNQNGIPMGYPPPPNQLY